VRTTVVCSCRYIGGFFVAPNLFFSDTLLYPVPPPIHARCPAVLASPPRFPTGYGPRRRLTPSTSTFRALARPLFPFGPFFRTQNFLGCREFFHPPSSHSKTLRTFLLSPRNLSPLVLWLFQPPKNLFQACKTREKSLNNHSHILFVTSPPLVTCEPHRLSHGFSTALSPPLPRFFAVFIHFSNSASPRPPVFPRFAGFPPARRLFQAVRLPFPSSHHRFSPGFTGFPPVHCLFQAVCRFSPGFTGFSPVRHRFQAVCCLFQAARRRFSPGFAGFSPARHSRRLFQAVRCLFQAVPCAFSPGLLVFPQLVPRLSSCPHFTSSPTFSLFTFTRHDPKT